MISRSTKIDLIAATGFGSLVYGCSWAWWPLGWIVGGGLLLMFAVWARQPRSNGETP